MAAVLLCLTLTVRHSYCACEKFPFTKAADSGHMTTTIFNQRPINRIRGRITDRLDEPVSNARVYVWRRPVNVSDQDFASGNVAYDEYKSRLTACETGEDGKFCFDGIPPGKYMVCAHGSGFNSTCVLVTVRARSRRSGFDIVLDVGT